MLCDRVHNCWIAFCTSGKHTGTEKAAFKRESSNNKQQHKTNNNKQQQQTTTVVSCFFFFVYLSMKRDTNECLSTQHHWYKGKKQFLQLLVVPSKLTFLKHKNSQNDATTRQRKKHHKQQKMVSFSCFSMYSSKSKLTHLFLCGSKRKKGKYDCFCCWLLFRSLTWSQNVQNRQSTQRDTTKHKKQQNRGKNRFDYFISFVFLLF